MYRKILILTSLALTSMCIAGSAQGKLNVKVEPRIELLTIVQYLADRGVYPLPSIYQKEVDGYFKKFKSSGAVERVKKMQSKKSPDAAYPGISMYASELPELKSQYPLPLHMDSARTWEYLNLCKEFAAETKFDLFLQSEKLHIHQWEQAVKDTITHYALTERLEKFMGYSRDWNIFLSPLVSWGAYNFSLPTENKDREIYFVLGYAINDKRKDPMERQPFFAIKKTLVDLVWHEGAHSYITPLIEQSKSEINKFQHLLTDTIQDKLQKAGRFRWTWDYYLNELIVRAIVARLIEKHFTVAEAELEMARQQGNGFVHLKRVYQLLMKYENTPASTPKDISHFFAALKKDIPNW